MPQARSHSVADMPHDQAIMAIEDHAMAATLDPLADPPPSSWSESFIDTKARPSDIDDIEKALMSFSITPHQYAEANYMPIYDISPSSSGRLPYHHYHPSHPSQTRVNGIKVQFNLAKSFCDRDDRFATDMHDWRNRFDMQEYKSKCINVLPSYSVGVWSAGGCVSAIGSIRAGFTPLWSTEIDQDKREMWEDLTGTECLGDTFKVDWSQQRVPDLLDSGQNCEAYSGSGPRSQGLPAGRYHKTGWMFVKQVDHILTLQPTSIKLEMSEGANDTNDGEEIQMVMDGLSSMYYCHLCRRLPTWKYGDGSNRKRMFIIGFHKVKCGEQAKYFTYPSPTCMEGYYPIAADYAVPDEMVPQDYWVYEPVGEVRMKPWRDPRVGELHKIAYVASEREMGPPQRPYAIYSWLSLFNTQVTTNGGGRRPPLSCTYNPDKPITWTRMVVPLETVRTAGLPDSYIQWFQSLRGSRTDNDLRSSVNSGIPLRTSVMLDTAIHAMLIKCGVPFSIKEGHMPSHHAHIAQSKIDAIDSFISTALPTWVDPSYRIRKVTLDTGATNTFLYTSVEPFLNNARKSHATIGTASAGAARMHTSQQGSLHCLVFNMAQYSSMAPVTPFIMPHVTTVPELSKELLSPDEFYRYGKYNILLRQPDYEGGVSELFREEKPGVPEARIPLLYDWVGNGGWHMYYMPSKGMSKSDESALARHMHNILEHQDKGTCERWRATHMSDSQAREMHANLVEHECVQEMRVSRFLRGEDSDEEEDQSQGGPSHKPYQPNLSLDPLTSKGSVTTTNKAVDYSHNPRLSPYITGQGTGVREQEGQSALEELMGSGTEPGNTLTPDDPHPKQNATIKNSVKHTHVSDQSQTPQVGGDQPVIVPVPNPKQGPKMNRPLLHHPCMAEIRGATARISKRGINRMSHDDKHNHFCHMGSNPKCLICRMAGGAMRKIYRKVDPYKEIRPGYIWTMDIMTPDVESLEGNRYQIILMDVASETLSVLNIAKRDQVYDSVEEWLSQLRSNPIYWDLPYPIVCIISTDNAGEWGYENKRWTDMAARNFLKMRYGCPDRKEEVARGERAVGLYEVLVKATLMERNLPPSWWQRASLDVVFCWNRFAKINYHPACPVDGDRARPIEVLTRGFFSRLLCDKQLAEYVPVGTPALVHDVHVKGSSMRPKTRWCVGSGMWDDQPIWWDPIINSFSRSKSYVSYLLAPGFNYTHFLRLPALPSIQRRCARDLEQIDEDTILHLPDCISPGEMRVDPTVIETVQPADESNDLNPQPLPPTLRDDYDTHREGRSTLGPKLIDSQGRQYKVDKSTGIMRPTVDNTPPTPSLIYGEPERRPINKVVQGETPEDDFRDTCEITSDYQDIVYSEVEAAIRRGDAMEPPQEPEVLIRHDLQASLYRRAEGITSAESKPPGCILGGREGYYPRLNQSLAPV